MSGLHPFLRSARAFVAARMVVYCASNISIFGSTRRSRRLGAGSWECLHLSLMSQLRTERVSSPSLCSKRNFFGPSKATDLGRGLSQAHEGLPFRGGRHRGQLQAVRLQLSDRREESGGGQGCGGKVRSGPVVLLVPTEVEGHLLADGGRPRAPLMLYG